MVGVYIRDDLRTEVESSSTEDSPSEIAPKLAIVQAQGVHCVGIVLVQSRRIESEASYTSENSSEYSHMTTSFVHAPSPKPAIRCIAVFLSN